MKTLTKRIYVAVVVVSVVCFTAFAQKTFGVTPAPDGDYPNKNTAEGKDALFGLTNGTANTAIGFSALKANTMGDRKTASGAFALFHSTLSVPPSLHYGRNAHRGTNP